MSTCCKCAFPHVGVLSLCPGLELAGDTLWDTTEFTYRKTFYFTSESLRRRIFLGTTYVSPGGIAPVSALLKRYLLSTNLTRTRPQTKFDQSQVWTNRERCLHVIIINGVTKEVLPNLKLFLKMLVKTAL